MTVELPPQYTWGFVVGRFIHAIADTTDDEDRFPEARGANGTVTFTPSTTLRRHTEPPTSFVLTEAVTADIVNGDLVDAEGQPGIYLISGPYRVAFNLQGGSIPSFTIEVTEGHTLTHPLDLVTAAPYVPSPGTPVTTLVVPAGMADDEVLAWRDGGLAWAPGASQAEAAANRAAAIRDDVQEISGLTGEDEAVAFLLADPDSMSGTAIRDYVGYVNVTDFGAVGDGETLDNAAFDAAMSAARPGTTVYVPGNDDGTPRTYLLDVGRVRPTGYWDQTSNRSCKGIFMSTPGVTLRLADTVIIKAAPNDFENYELLRIVAPDCTVVGGEFRGDVGGHTGTAGEWGMGVCVYAGAHNARIERVRATYCWGDGFYVDSADNVKLIDCVSHHNRRQGLSVTVSDRLQVLGGSYSYTGSTQSDISANGPGFAFPGTGIDIEPNAGESVTNFLVSGAEFVGNAWQGFMVASHAPGAHTDGSFVDCVSRDNRGSGASFESGDNPAGQLRIEGCTFADNNNGLKRGIAIAYDGAVISGCVVRGSGAYGVNILAPNVIIQNSVVHDNGRSVILDEDDKGILVYSTAHNTVIVGCTVNRASESHHSGIEVMNTAQNVKIISTQVLGQYSLNGVVRGSPHTIIAPSPRVYTVNDAATTADDAVELVNQIRAALIGHSLLRAADD